MFNVPNTLSALRIIVGFIVPFMVLVDDMNIRIWSAILFAIAAGTDWFDGWYARRYNLITKLGKIMDPIADKVIVLGTFIAMSSLTEINMYSIWWVVPIFFREVAITFFRIMFLIQERETVDAASFSGKAKTVVQMLTLPCAYFYFMFDYYGDIQLVVLWWVMYTMLIASVVFTMVSGWRFFERNWKVIRGMA